MTDLDLNALSAKYSRNAAGVYSWWAVETIDADVHSLLDALNAAWAELAEVQRQYNLRSSAITNLAKGAEMDAQEIKALKADLRAANNRADKARIGLNRLRRTMAELTRWADGEQREDVPVDEIVDVLKERHWEDGEVDEAEYRIIHQTREEAIAEVGAERYSHLVAVFAEAHRNDPGTISNPLQVGLTGEVTA